MARITSILAASKIGISSVIQPEGHEGESVPLILMSHEASDAAVQKALAKIRRWLPVVKGAPVQVARGELWVKLLRGNEIDSSKGRTAMAGCDSRLSGMAACFRIHARGFA